MDLFEKALLFAAEKHRGQKRKFSDAPYLLHPLEAATIVGSMTDDEETLAAALLHDTVEDTDATLDEIKEEFGKRVYLLVLTETEDKREDRPPEDTWRLRKEETLAIVENTKDISVKMMWLGDKLSNMRSFYRLYQNEGTSMWRHFHQKDPAEQLWYYNKIAAALSDLAGHEAYSEFIKLKNLVFEEVE